MLGELSRVLAPGGVLAISSPNRHRYPPGNPHHVREFSTGEFRALLGETFPRVRLLVQHQWIASAVMEESDLVGDGPQDIRAGIAAERALGSETYTVALAGTEPLPEPPPLAVFTDTVEVRRWMDHFDDQQTILARPGRLPRGAPGASTPSAATSSGGSWRPRPSWRSRSRRGGGSSARSSSSPTGSRSSAPTSSASCPSSSGWRR